MRGVFPVCVFRAWTPSLADRQMLSAFFCAYKFAVDVKQQVNNNHKGKSIRMERHPNDCKVENVTFRCCYLPLKI